MATSIIKGPQRATVGPLTFTREGRFVALTSAWEPKVSANEISYKAIGTIPTGMRPTSNVYIDALFGNTKNGSGTIEIKPDGTVGVATNASTGTVTNVILWANGIYAL